VSAAASRRSFLTRAAIVGLGAGAVSGLFGVGGGILIVPGLILVMHMEQRLAHGTSLAAVLPISVASLVGYLADGKVDWAVALPLSAGAVAGALVGTKLLHVLPHRATGFGFVGVILVTAVRLLTDNGLADGRSTLHVGAVLALVVTGLLTGILAGLFGVGGGVIMVPAMVMLFGMTPAMAKGTSVAVIIPTALMGTWRNRKNRNADLAVAVAVGLAGVVSAYLMAKVAVGMSDELSNTLFAILLLVVAARLTWDLVREGRQPVEELDLVE
jgi:hypothetical protein